MAYVLNKGKAIQERTNCKNCGAPIDSFDRCLYCGTMHSTATNEYCIGREDELEVINPATGSVAYLPSYEKAYVYDIEEGWKEIEEQRKRIPTCANCRHLSYTSIFAECKETGRIIACYESHRSVGLNCLCGRFERAK